jgi:hypothetical protein
LPPVFAVFNPFSTLRPPAGAGGQSVLSLSPFFVSPSAAPLLLSLYPFLCHILWKARKPWDKNNEGSPNRRRRRKSREGEAASSSSPFPHTSLSYLNKAIGRKRGQREELQTKTFPIQYTIFILRFNFASLPALLTSFRNPPPSTPCTLLPQSTWKSLKGSLLASPVATSK